MEKASNAIFDLNPVTFRYKEEVDPGKVPQFGLVAEEVEKIDPDLVVHDQEGKPFTVRYEAVNAMLLNEFLKEHKKVEEQEAIVVQLKSMIEKQAATIGQQQKGMETLAARVEQQASEIKKVSAELEVSKPLPPLAVNDQ